MAADELRPEPGQAGNGAAIGDDARVVRQLSVFPALGYDRFFGMKFKYAALPLIVNPPIGRATNLGKFPHEG